MAIIVAVTSADTFSGGASTLSVPVPSNADGDSVWIFYAARSTGATITETGDGGFSTTATAVTGGLWKSGFFHKVNSGSTVSTITISSTSSTYLSAIAFSVRGSAASPVGATASATTAGATTLQSPALTTTATNSLILHGIISESSLAQPETGTVSALAITNTGSGYAIGSSDFVSGSGASIPQIYYDQQSSRAAIAWAIEVKDDGNGNLPIRVTPNRTVLAYHGGYDRSAITTSAPNSVTGLTAIAGVSMATAALTLSNSSPSSAGWLYAGLRMESATQATEWQGVFEAHTVDLTGKILTIPYGNSWGYTNTRFGVYGQIVVLVDSSNNWAAYTLAARADLPLAAAGYIKFIKVGSTTPLDSGGTLDPANIVKIGYFVHRNSSGGAGTYYGYIGQLYYENSPAVFIGGTSSLPLTNAKIAAYLSNQTQWASIAPLQGGGQYLAYLSAQIGDGTNKTHYKSTGQSYEFPAAGASWALAANDIGLTLKGSASCTFNLSASIFSANSVQNFTVDSASSTSATYNFVGTSFIGLDWAANASINYASASYSGCNLTELGGGTITDSSVNTPAGTTAATVSVSGGTLDNVTISATKASGSTDYHLTLGTAVTAITLNDVTLTGTPAISNIRVLRTTGTVTITISGTTSSPSVSSAGATVVIDAPTVTADISVTGMPDAAGASRRLQIFNASAVSASAWQATTAYSAGAMRLRSTGIGTENTAGLYMRCTTGGTSGGTEPTWNTTPGGTTSDGTVTWTTYKVLFHDADPASTSYSTTYIDGEEFLAGETVTVRFAEMDAGTSFKRYSTSTIPTASGFSVLVDEVADEVYATNALDGSSYESTFSPDFVANYIILDTNTDFSGKAAYAYFCYTLTTSNGMYLFWGGVTALDVGNYRVETDTLNLYFDESAGFVKQTDDVRIFRKDGVRPALDPTTGGNGIEMNWRVPVSVVSTGGSALTPTESAQLMSLTNAPAASTVADAVWSKTLP